MRLLGGVPESRVVARPTNAIPRARALEIARAAAQMARAELSRAAVEEEAAEAEGARNLARLDARLAALERHHDRIAEYGARVEQVVVGRRRRPSTSRVAAVGRSSALAVFSGSLYCSQCENVLKMSSLASCEVVAEGLS